jgi:hypothetical protein
VVVDVSTHDLEKAFFDSFSEHVENVFPSRSNYLAVTHLDNPFLRVCFCKARAEREFRRYCDAWSHAYGSSSSTWRRDSQTATTQEMLLHLEVALPFCKLLEAVVTRRLESTRIARGFRIQNDANRIEPITLSSGMRAAQALFTGCLRHRSQAARPRRT